MRMSAVELPLLIEDAARFVGLHPVTLADRARRGKIPGAAKPGRVWIFPLEGLRAYRDSFSKCPFTGEVESGGSNSPRTAADFENLLALPTRKRRRNITKKGAARYGGRQNSAKALR